MNARSNSDVRACALPPEALLARYSDAGAYADCWVAELAGRVSHAAFVEAFYTGALIRIERLFIGLLLSRPSTDADVKQLAASTATAFAAWRVEARCEDQLLLCDASGRTRSWLMVRQAASHTKLYFGSAVVPKLDAATGQRRMGPLFAALLGFHKLYSRALLGSARTRLETS